MPKTTTYKSSVTTTLLVMGLIVFIGLIVIVLIQRSSEQAGLVASPAGQAFTADFADNYTDTVGNTISLSDMVGVPFVVTTWASWCPHCFDDLVEIDNVMNDFSTMRALAINRKESQSQVTRYLATTPELANVELIIDTSDQFFTTVDGYTMPETLVFNESGEVVYHSRGNINPTQLRSQLESLSPRQ